MVEKKIFIDFIITGVLILLFSGFYLIGPKHSRTAGSMLMMLVEEQSTT